MKKSIWLLMVIPFLSGSLPVAKTQTIRQYKEKRPTIDSCISLCFGDLVFTVAPQKGGRILSFKKAGKEVLASDTVHPLYYGATLWLSPQSAYWPQYSVMDLLPYQLESTSKSIRLTSPVDQGIQVIKEFSVSKADTSIAICYTIRNASGPSKKLAPWEVTRVLGGCSFFPVGAPGVSAQSDISGTVTENGILWLPPTGAGNKKGQKLFSGIKEGWIAHYYNGLLLVKCFPEVPQKDLPPGQGAAEIYVAPMGRYRELENHGKYSNVQPGQYLQYHEKWLLRNVGHQTKETLLSIVAALNKKIK
ncbi:DUF4380 domain-containing protein [Niabella ginsenosidivorans]|nr:DUF4380 domain-containing protein [Niabella ginsenosidivorans]